MHLIDKHKFPKNFDFRVVQGSFRVKSKEKDQETKPNTVPVQSEEENSKDMTDTLISSFSKLSIPRSVQLRRIKETNQTTMQL